MVVYNCVSKLSVRLGHDNLILAKGGHQGGVDTIIQYSLRRRRERSHTVNVQYLELWLC